MSWARCSVCDETFGGDSGFDRHRIIWGGGGEYEWRCATPEEMRRRGMHQDEKGWWHQEARFGRGAGLVADSQPVSHAEAEAYDRHRDFISWAEQDRREDSRYADEEPRP